MQWIAKLRIICDFSHTTTGTQPRANSPEIASRTELSLRVAEERFAIEYGVGEF